MRLPSLLRRVSDPLLHQMRMPVLSGVNRGRWWSLVSAGGGYGTGLRQSAQVELIASLIGPGDCVWDVGAHHGFVTLAMSRRVGPSGAVHAFEPGQFSRGVLERHLRWNGIDNATVHPYALSDVDGQARFGGTGSTRSFALDAGPECVEVRRADTLIAGELCPGPSFAKIDVENAEAHVLAGGLAALSPDVRLLISMHSADADRACTELLDAAGFELVASRALCAARERAWSSDPDLFAMGPAYAGRERDHAILRAQSFE